MRREGAADDPLGVEEEIVEVHDLARARRQLFEADGSDGPPRRRALTWVGVGVVAVLATAVVGVNVAEVRQESARLRGLVDVPGVLALLDGPLEVVWRVPGGQLFAATDDAIVLSDITGEESLSAIEPSTGALLWSRVLAAGERCVPVGGDSAAGRAAMIVCSPIADPAEVTEGVVAPPARLLALDIAGGQVVRSLELETPPMTVDIADDDLVVSLIGDRATVQVLRWDPSADRVVWAYRSEPGRAEVIESDGWWMSVQDDGLLWYGHDRFLAISPSTGHEVPADEPPALGSLGRALALPDGGSVEWSLTREGRPTGSLVRNGDGSVRYAFDGEPWLASVTDGSEPDVLAVRRPVTRNVVGLDAHSGDQLWAARTMQGMYPYLQIDGVVISVGTLRAIAIDLTDGARLWEQSIGRPRTWPLTDGRVVLLLTREHGVLGISAHLLRTGTSDWRVAVPDDAYYLDQAGDDTVLVHTQRETIAYR